MFLNVTVHDKNQTPRGSVRLQLDFATMQWSIPTGQDQAWKGVGFSSPARGAFEVKSWGVIWLWDQRPGEHNVVILWDAPTGPDDTEHPEGGGRIFDPKEPDQFKEGKITWGVEGASRSGLAPIRQRFLDVIARIPFQFDPVFKVNFPSGPSTAPVPGAVTGKVTNCGALPGYVVGELGGSGVPADAQALTFKDGYGTYALTAPMTGWEKWAKKLDEKRQAAPGSAAACWRPFSLKQRPDERPLPGDIYILFGYTKVKDPATRQIDGTYTMVNGQYKYIDMYGFAHVGIVIAPTGGKWQTADCGQGGGYGGCYQWRTYDDKKGQLTLDNGKKQSDSGSKDLRGWVDIEKLFAGWKP